MDPKGKSISNRFDLIVYQRRKQDKNNPNASGISEEQTELNDLLDDIIHHRDKLETELREKREEWTAQDKKLYEAEKKIRIHSTSRMNIQSSKNATGEEHEQKRRKTVVLDSDDENFELPKKSLAQRRQNDQMQMDSDCERSEEGTGTRERGEIEEAAGARE